MSSWRTHPSLITYSQTRSPDSCSKRVGQWPLTPTEHPPPPHTEVHISVLKVKYQAISSPGPPSALQGTVFIKPRLESVTLPLLKTMVAL